MKRTFNLAIVIAVVLVTATVAVALAGTGRSPQPSDVQVMVTDRSAEAAPATAVIGGTTGGATASDGNLSGPDKLGGSKGHSMSAGGSKPSPKKSTVVSGKKKRSEKKPTEGPADGKSSVEESADHGDDDFEVVMPHVHDSDDGKSDAETSGRSDWEDGSNKGD